MLGPTEDNSIGRRAFAISFGPPVRMFWADDPLPLNYVEPLRIGSADWYPQESPLAFPPDILYLPSTRIFIGLTFAIVNFEQDLARIKDLTHDFDSSVIRIQDHGTEVWEKLYGSSCYQYPYLEIFWYPSDDYAYQLGQLPYGDWSWHYPCREPNISDYDMPWTKPLGISVSDIHEVLSGFGLRFPSTLSFPSDRFEIRKYTEQS